MLTEKDYCDYETCVALKELGFPIDWFEDETYHENNTEISLYEAQKWLREEKGIAVMVIRDYWCATRYNPYCRHYSPKLYRKCGHFEKVKAIGNEPVYDSYEEALSEGIKETIKILTNNINE